MDGPRKNKSICYVFSGTLIISAILAARHCATIDYMGNSNVPLHGIMMKNIWENDILSGHEENYFPQKRDV